MSEEHSHDKFLWLVGVLRAYLASPTAYEQARLRQLLEDFVGLGPRNANDK